MDNRMNLINAFHFFAVRKRADRKSMGFGLAAFLRLLSTSKTMKPYVSGIIDASLNPPAIYQRCPLEQFPRLPTHSEPAQEKKGYVELQGSIPRRLEEGGQSQISDSRDEARASHKTTARARSHLPMFSTTPSQWNP